MFVNGNQAALGGSTVAAASHQPGGFSIFKHPPCIWPESMAGQPWAPLRVLIVDSDTHGRGVVAQELMGESRTIVAGQAGTLREGRRLLRDVGFDVLLVDVSLADGPGFELISQARKLPSAVEVVALADAEREDDALRAFSLGASGFLVKGSWFIAYAQAVLQVANGGAAITPALSRKLLLKGPGPARKAVGVVPDVGGQPLRIKLSTREQEVLRMIATGLTSTQIGDQLAISCTTVNSHVKNMYQKLQVRTRAQAVSCASAWGLL